MACQPIQNPIKYTISFKGDTKRGNLIIDLDQSIIKQLDLIEPGDTVQVLLPERMNALNRALLHAKIEECLTLICTTKMTINDTWRKWYRNMWFNQKYFPSAKSVIELPKQGKSVLIAGNGPSLSETLAHKIEIPILAAWHSAGKVIKSGHKLTGVGHLDALTVQNFNDFESFDPKQVDYAISCPTVCQEFLDHFKEIPLYLYLGNNLPENYYTAELYNLPMHMGAGPTIIVTLIQAAILAGYKEIYIAGVDLSFPTKEEVCAYMGSDRIDEMRRLGSPEDHIAYKCPTYIEGVDVYTYSGFATCQSFMEYLPTVHPTIRFYNTSLKGMKLAGWPYKAIE